MLPVDPLDIQLVWPWCNIHGHTNHNNFPYLKILMGQKLSNLALEVLLSQRWMHHQDHNQTRINQFMLTFVEITSLSHFNLISGILIYYFFVWQLRNTISILSLGLRVNRITFMFHMKYAATLGNLHTKEANHYNHRLNDLL